MRMNRFSPAVLIGVVLCTSGNDRSFAAGNGDANENVASTATPEDPAMRGSAYDARHAARDDFDRCITLGTDLPLAYGNRAEVELMLGDNSAAAADITQAQSLIATMPDSPVASPTPSARKNQTHHDARRSGTVGGKA